jgi:hypothetical protein
MWKKDMNSLEVARLIERFLGKQSSYEQEWNDFVDTPQENKDVEAYRKRCYQLDPLVNRPEAADLTAVEELRSMIEKLRSVT